MGEAAAWLLHTGQQLFNIQEAALHLLLAALSLATAMEGRHGRPVLLEIAMDSQMDNPWKLLQLLQKQLPLLLVIQEVLLSWAIL